MSELGSVLFYAVCTWDCEDRVLRTCTVLLTLARCAASAYRRELFMFRVNSA